MDVTPQMIDDVAELARLSFTDEEKQAYVVEFGKILGLVETLNELDADQTDSYGFVSGLPSNMSTPLREDAVTCEDMRERTLENAPQKEDSCFVVPKIMADSE